MNIKRLAISCSIITIISGASLSAHADGNIAATLLGAAGGAAIGSNIGKGSGRVAAIAVGTLLGAGIGNNIQASNASASEYYDHGYRHHRRNYIHPMHNHHYYNYSNYPAEQAYWVNPDYQTQVVQVNNNYQTNGQAQAPAEYCREFNQSVTIGGKVQPGYGVACLQPDGSWQIKK